MEIKYKYTTSNKWEAFKVRSALLELHRHGLNILHIWSKESCVFTGANYGRQVAFICNLASFIARLYYAFLEGNRNKYLWQTLL